MTGHSIDIALSNNAVPWRDDMTLSAEAIEKLKKPLGADRVKTRQQSGRAVAYIEGYDAINIANEVFGFDGWSYTVEGIDPLGGDEKRRLYQAVVRVIVGSAIRSDVGHGISAGDSSEAQETAIKGAVTDALKRALRSFGAQFGNSLYDKDGPELAAPRCEKHGLDMQQGRTGKWGHVLEDGKTPCFGEAA